MIKIVVDSGCDLTNNVLEKMDVGIESVPLTIHIGDKVYIDDKKLDIDEFLYELENNPNTPKTAAPSPELYFKNYSGNESVFAITLSSHLSSSYNSAVIAKNMYLDEIGNKFIHVFDSLSASVGETIIALKINDMAKLNLSETEVMNYISGFIKNLKTFFLLERFDTIVKTGRMNPYVAKLASMLSIQPICAGIGGKMKLLTSARGYKNAVKKLIDIVLAEDINFEERILGISHVKCLDKALAFKDEILKKIKFKDVIIVESSGLCATYASRNGIIISF